MIIETVKKCIPHFSIHHDIYDSHKTCKYQVAISIGIVAAYQEQVISRLCSLRVCDHVLHQFYSQAESMVADVN